LYLLAEKRGSPRPFRQKKTDPPPFHTRSVRDRACKAQIRAIADGKTDPSVFSPGFTHRGWDNGRKKRPWKRPFNIGKGSNIKERLVKVYLHPCSKKSFLFTLHYPLPFALPGVNLTAADLFSSSLSCEKKNSE
jgi:hypothetical protein